MTDTERLAYYDAVLRAARRYGGALERGDVVATPVAYVQFVRVS